MKLDRSWNAVEFLFVALFCLSVRAQQPSRRSPEKILELNRWLKAFCAANSHVYLDYFSTMADTKGLLKRDLADDGLHPNLAGYKLMVPLAQAAIEKALPRSAKP
jgi:lysophospholipase L1-like esterase